MKLKKVAAAMSFGLCAIAAFAQTPATPAPADSPAAPAAAPANPPVPPAPAAPTAAGRGTIVEGKLFTTQRSRNDKNTFDKTDRGTIAWICTYSVEGARRSVQLDESCPPTMAFELKR